jgi:hypothetical protein
MMMIYLINQRYGDANVKSHPVKKTIVNVILEVKNVPHYANVKIVKIRREYKINKKRKLKLNDPTI